MTRISRNAIFTKQILPTGSRMTALRLLIVLVLLHVADVSAGGEHTPTERKALLAVAPEYRHLDGVMAAAEGDLNGDGIPDLALILTGQKGEGPREERLFVLVGSRGGSFQVLSVSGEFCHPSKFYSLDIKNNSLYVQAVFYAGSDRFSGFSLQFRYGAKIKDLEHIGELQEDKGYPSDSSYKVSLNYLTNVAIVSRRAGKKYKEVRGWLTDTPRVLPLNGFVCAGYGMTSTSVYIDENFKVEKKSGKSQ